MSDRRLYDEEREMNSFYSWTVILLFSMSIIAYGVTVFLLVRDAPRHWEVGQMPDTPAASPLSSQVPMVREAVPQQVEPLPEAVQQQRQGPQPAKEPEEEVRR